jgi:branched-chain amino acid transport system substrate-binding protein
MLKLGRRSSLRLGLASGAALATRSAWAADKILTIGMSVPLTGALARQSIVVSTAARFAVDEANAKGGVAGYTLRLMLLDDGSTTTGQYDPALSATNARRMISDPTVIAAVGPLNSGSAKAMSPVFSQGGIAFISGSATNPDLNNPKFFPVYHPAGKPNFFRTVTTDAYQGPGMANFFAETLKRKKVTVLDDTGAYGVGMANAFAEQAVKKGMDVVLRDRLDPLNADYTSTLTRAKSLGTDALYFGGDPLAGVKLVKQSFDIIPDAAKGGGDGAHTPDMLTGGGMPAINGWYASSAASHVLDNGTVQPWIKQFEAQTKSSPADYSITYYDAVQVILDAVRRAAAAGKPVTRETVREAMLSTKLDLLQGEVSFDKNGDLASTAVSIFQVQYTKAYPIEDVIHQFHYVGPAPVA